MVDSVMCGVARRLAASPVEDPSQFGEAYKALLEISDYVIASTRSTADEEFVKKRLDHAVDAFAKVK
jgi:hypothetical protein